MTLDEFWDHIRASRRKDPEAHVERLVARLAKLPPDEIIDFDHWWHACAAGAYRWDLWGAAYLMNGGCSDDGFTDFRSWLILQGRVVYEAALADPDSLADLEVEEEEADCECYPGSTAWFRATGREDGTDEDYAAFRAAYAARHSAPRPEPDMCEPWDFDDDAEVKRRLPRLARLYLPGARGSDGDD